MGAHTFVRCPYYELCVSKQPAQTPCTIETCGGILGCKMSCLCRYAYSVFRIHILVRHKSTCGASICICCITSMAIDIGHTYRHVTERVSVLRRSLFQSALVSSHVSKLAATSHFKPSCQLPIGCVKVLLEKLPP